MLIVEFGYSATLELWFSGLSGSMVNSFKKKKCTKIPSKLQAFSGGDEYELYDYHFDAGNRVTVEEEIHDKVSENTREILSLGPGFVPARRINNTIIQDVEVSCERVALGY